MPEILAARTSSRRRSPGKQLRGAAPALSPFQRDVQVQTAPFSRREAAWPSGTAVPETELFS